MTTVQRLIGDLLGGDLTAALPLLDALEEGKDFRRVTLNRCFGRLMCDWEAALLRCATAVAEGYNPAYAEQGRDRELVAAWWRFHGEVRHAFWAVAELDMPDVGRAVADFKRAIDRDADEREIPF